MLNSLSLTLNNLTSITVLVFALGFIGARLNSDLKIPDPVYQIISIYLLFGIGLKGGVALNGSSFNELIKPVIATIILGILIPVLAFLALKQVKKLNDTDRGAISAFYGSTSLVTFTAALIYLETLDIDYEGFATTLLTIMEIPGLIVGIFIASRLSSKNVPWKKSIEEIVLGKTVLLLVGGLLIGFITGKAGYGQVEPFFVNLLPGILALFLLHLGFVAGSQIHLIKEVGLGLFIFAVAFPIFAGLLGVVAGQLAGLSVGGATILGVLSASASYIAAPAAISIALPSANQSLALTSSIGITFPFNLIFGIPIIHAIALFLFT